MQCRSPIGAQKRHKGSVFRYSHPCGRCRECLINRREGWVARCLLELKDHTEACFLTLTYAPGTEPEVLDVDHVQRFMKRLRHSGRFRYFGVGEYGDKYGRPHWHYLIFGREFDRGLQMFPKWDYGFAFVGDVNQQSARYVAGYQVNAMGSNKKPVPSMSRRPGIGFNGLIDLYNQSLEVTGKPPQYLFQGDKKFYFPAYYRDKMSALQHPDLVGVSRLPGLDLKRSAFISVFNSIRSTLDEDERSFLLARNIGQYDHDWYARQLLDEAKHSNLSITQLHDEREAQRVRQFEEAQKARQAFDGGAAEIDAAYRSGFIPPVPERSKALFRV